MIADKGIEGFCIQQLVDCFKNGFLSIEWSWFQLELALGTSYILITLHSTLKHSITKYLKYAYKYSINVFFTHKTR